MLFGFNKMAFKNKFCLKKKKQKDNGSEKSHFLKLNHHKGSINANY